MATYDKFTSFGRKAGGRVVTQYGGMCVMYARNPYGTHNLVAVDDRTGGAIRHGNIAVTEFVRAWLSERAYRRVRRFLADRGVGLEWTLLGPDDMRDALSRE